MDPKEQKYGTPHQNDRVEQRSNTQQSSDNRSEKEPRSDVRSEAKSDNDSKEKEPAEANGENICEVEAKTPEASSRNVANRAEMEELGNKMRVDQKKIVTQLSGSGILATLKRSQDKQTTGPRRKLTAESTDEPLFKDKNFDDDMPVSTMAQIAEANPFLMNRSHRADFVLVKNKDNNGTLFVGDRPFWQGRSDGDDMPLCERRTMSQIVGELGANRAQFRELSAIAQTGNRSVFDPLFPREKMEERNRLYFSAKQVEVNTIVTIIQTLQVEKEPTNQGKEAVSCRSVTTKGAKGKTKEMSKTRKKTKIVKKPLSVGSILEPTMAVSYKKYEIKKREMVAFNRTGMGVCKKQLKTGLVPAQLSDSITSSSSSSKSETSPMARNPVIQQAPTANQNYTQNGTIQPPEIMPVARKQATARRSMSKKR